MRLRVFSPPFLASHQWFLRLSLTFFGISIFLLTMVRRISRPDPFNTWGNALLSSHRCRLSDPPSSYPRLLGHPFKHLRSFMFDYFGLLSLILWAGVLSALFSVIALFASTAFLIQSKRLCPHQTLKPHRTFIPILSRSAVTLARYLFLLMTVASSLLLFSSGILHTCQAPLDIRALRRQVNCRKWVIGCMKQTDRFGPHLSCIRPVNWEAFPVEGCATGSLDESSYIGTRSCQVYEITDEKTYKRYDLPDGLCPQIPDERFQHLPACPLCDSIRHAPSKTRYQPVDLTKLGSRRKELDTFLLQDDDSWYFVGEDDFDDSFSRSLSSQPKYLSAWIERSSCDSAPNDSSATGSETEMIPVSQLKDLSGQLWLNESRENNCDLTKIRKKNDAPDAVAYKFQSEEAVKRWEPDIYDIRIWQHHQMSLNDQIFATAFDHDRAFLRSLVAAQQRQLARKHFLSSKHS